MRTDDGGLDLFDLLYDRIVHLDADEAQALSEGDPALLERLEALCLLETPLAQTLRDQLWARHRAELRPADSPTIDQTDWGEANRWDEAIVSAFWRSPERLRRLAESRAAGQTFLRLPGFLTEDALSTITHAVRALPFERLDTPWVRGHRRLLQAGDVSIWTTFLRSPRTRDLLGALLGRRLPAALTANAWRMREGDGMPVHADGRRYHGTISLGLSHGWTASHGGAIAMGVPAKESLQVRERWLPHAGDLLIFAPTRTSWHAVEPIARGERLSVTAWWTDDEVTG